MATQTPLTGGHWITVHGHHVYIKGQSLSAQHLEDIATKTGLSDNAKAHLKAAHAQGLLTTDKQIYNAVSHIKGAVAVGFDENHAIHEALQLHSQHGHPAAPVMASGSLDSTPVWKKSTPKGNVKYGGHVGVLTHGASVTPQEAEDYASHFHLDAGGKKELVAAVNSGGITSDTHLAKTVADAIHVHKMTGISHGEAVKNLMAGQTATQLIGNHKSATAASAPAAPTPAPAKPAPPAPSFSNDADYANHAGLHGMVNGIYPVALQQLKAAKLGPSATAEIIEEASKIAAADGKTQLNTAHITQALTQYSNAHPLLLPKVPQPVAIHHVTIQGKKFDVDHTKLVSAADVDELKNHIKVSYTGEKELKAAIASGEISTHGQLLEKAAMAQAGSTMLGYTSVNNPGYQATKAHAGVEALLDAAHHGDATAKSIEAKLEPHSFTSPAKTKAQARATKTKQATASFSTATPAEHMAKQVGVQGGYNQGALYELPDGTQNYVKTLPTAVAHNEHLANAIYNALGISAPQSKVFEHQGKTQYASLVIPNKGDLATQGISRDTATEILKGFAADSLLGNHDVLGNGNKPLSNVVIGHDGKPHRIDNGGSLLFKGTGVAKPDSARKNLREWEGFADPGTNANYAKVFKAAGVKDAAAIPGIGAQVKAIAALRDQAGGWDKFIEKHAPDMPATQRAETAALLEARTKLLEDKVKNVPGANSLVGQRKFTYDNAGGTSYGHGDAHENALIAHHKANAPTLTPDEVATVKAFKGGDYSSWNRNLMGQDPLTPKQAKQTRILDEMFQKPGMTLGIDSALSRKILLKDHERADLEKLAPGSIIAHTPVFQSTTTNSNTWGGNTHFCILAPKEMPAVTPKAHTSLHASENEVLLPRGISYRVVAVVGPNGPEPAETPDGWKWQSGATRVILEAIVPSAGNGAESDQVPTHIIAEDKLKQNAATLAQNHAKVPLPNVSGLHDSTIPQWNQAAPTKPPGKKKPSAGGGVT